MGVWLRARRDTSLQCARIGSVIDIDIKHILTRWDSPAHRSLWAGAESLHCIAHTIATST